MYLTIAATLHLVEPAIAMAQQECTFIWREADLNRDGELSVYEEIHYFSMLRVANKTMVADGTFADRLFQEGCKTNRLSATAIVQKTDLLEFERP